MVKYGAGHQKSTRPPKIRDFRCTPKATARARSILHPASLAAALPAVFRQMRRHFPQARAFGVSLLFWSEAVETPKAASTSAGVSSKSDAPSVLESSSEAEKRHQQAERKKRLREQWRSLASQQRIAIRDTVYNQAEAFVRLRIEQYRYNDPLVELACLDELERQSM